MQNKIWVIKAIREQTGYGLKEAIDLCNNYEEEKVTAEEGAIVELAQTKANELEEANQKDYIRRIIYSIGSIKDDCKYLDEFNLNDADEEMIEDFNTFLDHIIEEAESLKKYSKLIILK